MQYGKKTIDLSLVLSANHFARESVDGCASRALAALSDPKRKERLEKPECICCFYIRTPRIGGAAMTTQPCGKCEQNMMFGSTSTDMLCPDCAKKLKLCRHCGADLNLKDRRKI